MKNKFLILIIFFIAQLCAHQISFAQAAYNEDELDSPDEPAQVKNNNEGFSDTVLKKTLFDYDRDSLKQWRRSRDFAYMNYLDSLLRKKTDLKSDTVSIDPNTGKVKRGRKSSTDYTGINQFFNSLPIKIFFWALALFFIGFIFYKIFLKNGIFAHNKNKTVESEEEASSPELVEISKYDWLIAESESQNDFNLSTRYLYLQTLKTLSDKELISFLPDKTNKHYLQEMAANTHHHQFASLTRSYEYVWYGKFLINRTQYQKLKEEFILFKKNL